jgi:hypothetical protein
MRVSIIPILLLWEVLLFSGSVAGPRAGLRAIPPAHPLPSLTLAANSVPTIEAGPPRVEWPRRISEAVTNEEESDDDETLFALNDDLDRGRLHGDRGVMSPIRPDRGFFRAPFRSSILRC